MRNRAMPVPRRHRMVAEGDAAKDPASWTLVAIRAANDLGMVRTGMTYDKEYGTSAAFYEKPRRLQYMEGPNEPAVADHLEMNPRFLDFQFQPLDLTFRRGDGKLVHKYPDVIMEYDDNSVRVGEIKSNRDWFASPGIRRPLDRIDVAFAAVGLGPMLHICGEDFRRDDSMREAHEIAIDARLTTFRSEEVAAVRASVSAAGGYGLFDDVVAAIGGRRSHAVDKLYAMMLKRIVAFDLRAKPRRDTSVTLPRPARAYALRALLNRFKSPSS